MPSTKLVRPFQVAEAYGTYEIAALMLCSPSTVAKAIDNGRLRGFEVLGRRRLRRVLHVDLKKFLQSKKDFAPILERLEAAENGEP